MPPPLPPTPVGHAVGSASPKVVVEAFLDLNCPFSRKAFKTLTEGPDAVVQAYADKPVAFVFQQVIQPWHPAGSIMHEAALAVKAVKAAAYMAYMAAVYDAQEQFSDAATWDKSRAQMTVELVQLAAGVGVDPEAVIGRLAIKGGGNSGNATTQQVKFATKYHRVRGVHVTPTVFVNGLEAVEVSSSWTAAQWKEFLDGLLAAQG